MSSEQGPGPNQQPPASEPTMQETPIPRARPLSSSSARPVSTAGTPLARPLSTMEMPVARPMSTFEATARPPTTFSLAGGDRFSRALTLVGDAPVPSASEPKAAGATEAAASGTDEEDLKPPTVFANAASGDATPSRLSIADSAQLPGANLPYRDSLAPTAAGSAQNLSEKAVSDGAPAAVSPTPDLGPQSDEEDPSKKKRKKLFLILGG
ncbi:hypothetical protein FRC01_013146, partial [Tulasnella sp. 417]